MTTRIGFCKPSPFKKIQPINKDTVSNNNSGLYHHVFCKCIPFKKLRPANNKLKLI